MLNDISEAARVFLAAAHETGAGKVSVELHGKDGNPIAWVGALVEPELIARVKAVIEAFDAEAPEGEADAEASG